MCIGFGGLWCMDPIVCRASSGVIARPAKSPTPLPPPSSRSLTTLLPLPLAPPCTANRNVLEALWTNFNQVADGFGLNLAVFQTICSGVDGLRVTAEQCQKLFAAFDSDQVGVAEGVRVLPQQAQLYALFFVLWVRQWVRLRVCRGGAGLHGSCVCGCGLAVSSLTGLAMVAPSALHPTSPAPRPEWAGGCPGVPDNIRPRIGGDRGGEDSM